MEDEQSLVGGTEACALLGMSRATYWRRIREGKIKPVMQMPGKTGAYLFDRAEIMKLAAELSAKVAAS